MMGGDGGGGDDDVFLLTILPSLHRAALPRLL
jgi:hypothetical protein